MLHRSSRGSNSGKEFSYELIYLKPRISGESSRYDIVWRLGAIAGWVVAISSTIFIDSSHPTPGATTLMPVAVAALIIVAGAQSRGLQPLAWLGDISFSLYLVHWPIIIFFASGKSSLALSTRMLILGLSIAVAALLYAC